MSVAKIAAAALGKPLRSGEWWRCCCPIHGSRGPTLALRDGKYGLIAYCHAGCDRALILDELRRRGLISGRASTFRSHGPKPDKRPIVNDCDAEDEAAWQREKARRIWTATLDPHGTPVVDHLLARGITLDPPPVIGWSPDLWRPDGTRGPAMVALVEHVERGPVGISRTWLERDAAGVWRRLDRAFLGPIGGGAVRSAPAAETLMVGEGIETCLAAMQATGMPAWAALSAPGMEALVLPDLVRDVIILADNDTNGRGQRAASNAAQRWLAEERRVRIAMPPAPDTDFNDLLIEQNLEHIHHG